MNDHEGMAEFWNERAAIREFCGGMDRAKAEFLAVRDTRKEFGECPAEIVDRVQEFLNGSK